MIFRDEFVDTDQRYLLSFLGALFMQHMAHFLCHYYTTKRPLCVEFIDFPALLYDKIRGLNLGLCLQSEGGVLRPLLLSIPGTTGHLAPAPIVYTPAYSYTDESRSRTSAGITAASEQVTRIPRLYI